jgi:hypothetical protein
MSGSYRLLQDSREDIANETTISKLYSKIKYLKE